ncbi:hypothetical protein F0562_011863 [Nyssa sinensis]|uniref:Cupin type-1 domain-containing protein n=1 Tax=Nyssa sinensis TaxID=561372 RepID=A0A5J4ZUX9_9ASTE|nr:hypothetical protein F0562_011863 [Nyssa sinensis]
MDELPDSFDCLTSNCLLENPWRKFPFTTFVTMLSAILTLMMDSFALSYYKKHCFEVGVQSSKDCTHVELQNNNGYFHASGMEELDDKQSQLLRHRVVAQGSMMAPHFNPTATEYGIVLRGTGTIQIVFPNGTSAMNVKVKEGDVFWVPRYFPFCQIASQNGPFEFFGFTTSTRKNRPQFLVGRNSILQSMMGPEFATAFGMSKQSLQSIIDAQHESVILPSSSVAPPDEAMWKVKEKMKNKAMPKVIRSFGNDFE